MLSKFTKKRALLLAGIAALACAGIAFAFFSSTGGGSGTGTVASPSTAVITIHGTPASNPVPGADVSVPLTADNSAASPVRVHNVSATVAVDSDHVTAGCSSSDFSFTTTTEDEDVPASTNGHSLPNDGTLHMDNTSSNQNACKGATLTLTYSSN